jgi:hypothetical protein
MIVRCPFVTSCNYFAIVLQRPVLYVTAPITSFEKTCLHFREEAVILKLKLQRLFVLKEVRYSNRLLTTKRCVGIALVPGLILS